MMNRSEKDDPGKNLEKIERNLRQLGSKAFTQADIERLEAIAREVQELIALKKRFTID